ncbi:MAG: sulfite exporter TauE/SafE family protein [Clostridia bacterium]|nr:sulfite exporter TauE/SafE family protein [Clostridia bacterium]
MLEYAVGFFTAALAGLGVGGGGLLVIYLVLCAGVKQLAAQGINLIFFLFSSGAAMLIHFRKRRIPLKFTLLLSAAGIAGAVLGSMAAETVSDELVRTLFGVLLTVSGTIALFR